jgi:hypothetical protein
VADLPDDQVDKSIADMLQNEEIGLRRRGIEMVKRGRQCFELAAP